MAARATDSATITFGLVAIPVKLFTGTRPGASIHFNLLHESCGARVRRRYYCPNDDELLDNDDLVKGYEFAKGHYVTFSDEELKAVEEEASHAIEIAKFVPLAAVDPIYYDRPYYLGPDKGGDRPYQLLRRVMIETGLAAIARYAARGKQYLVMLRPAAGGIALQQLHYADEVRDISEVPLGEPREPKKEELELARRLVEQYASDEFHPEHYDDAVRRRLAEIIEAKVEGRQVTAAPAEAPRAEVIDIMEALKASLAEQGGERGARGRDRGERKPARRASRRSAPAKKSAKK